MNKKILVVDTMHDSLGDMLNELGYEMDYRPDIDRPEILQIIDGYEGLIIRSKTIVDQEIIEKAKRLRFVGRAGAGLDKLDVKGLTARGVSLLNAPEGNRDAVGEHVLGMILGLANKLRSSDIEIRSGQWNREGNRGFELNGKTVGIFGYGFMGSTVAEKLKGFGCNVIAFDKYKSGFSSDAVTEVTWDEFTAHTEVLSVNVPLTSETKGFFNEECLLSFEQLKFLINTARGEVVVLKDLVKLLSNEDLIGAGLDVLENEKINNLTEDEQNTFNALVQLPNVILSPHVAGWTFDSYRRINEVLVKKISELNE
ncbi:MAG: phosphoglycerate dehydrogenase [Cyclobacteriaceae bacterium]